MKNINKQRSLVVVFRTAFLALGFLCFSGTSGTAQTMKADSPSDDIVRRALSCDVIFGSSSATCFGTGICQISARTSKSKLTDELRQDCLGTVGMQSQIEGGKGVSLLLTQNLLCPQFYKTHLRNGFLIQESPCKLSKDVIEILGLKISELPIGEYPIQESNGYLKIEFRIPDAKK